MPHNQAPLIDAAFDQVLRVREASTVTPGSSVPPAAGPLWPGLLPPLPDMLPGYRIIDEIHRGGQGVVYRARQETTERDVAIKLMREGPLTTADERARFEREVRILGQLKHPNIVAIHHSGAAHGCSFFVMDLIDGLPLDEFMAAVRPSLERTLQIFADICSAVAAAHMRGVIHRDLKPGNIRVDGTGKPHVLDFGLSKQTGGGDASSMTLTGQFVGTAPWASPEQAAGETDTLDVRSDVYSLGVLLYQMLTGRFPYSVQGSPREVLDNIQHAEPVPPRRYRPGLPRDLEVIVLRCLQKDRERRYLSAGGLLRDVERFANGQPIEARADSVLYVLRKQVSRHKAPAAIAATFLLLIVAGFATSATFWRQAVVAQHDAQERAKEAQRQAEIAQAVNDFLNQDLLASVAPSAKAGRGRDVLMRDVLDAAAARIDEATAAGGRLADKPLVEAAIRQTLAETYMSLGIAQAAAPHARRVHALYADHVGENASETLRSMSTLAGALHKMGNYAEAEPLLRIALEGQRETLAPGASEVLLTMRRLATCCWRLGRADDAAALLEAAAEEARAAHGPDHPETLMVEGALAIVYATSGNYAGAEALFRRAYEIRRGTLGADHPDTLSAQINLATFYRTRGQLDEAETLMRSAMEVQKRILGPEHPDTLAGMINLTSLLRGMRRFEEAELVGQEALAISSRTQGEQHPDTVRALSNLARVYQEAGRAEEAEAMYEQALAGRRAALGEDHVDTIGTLKDLATLYYEQERFEALEPMFRDIIAREERVLGSLHPNTIDSHVNLALLYQRLGRLEEAEAYYRLALERAREAFGPDDVITARNASDLADLYLDLHRWEEAETLSRAALAICREKLPAGHAHIAAASLRLGMSLSGQQRYAEAEPLLLEAYDLYAAFFGADEEHTQDVVTALIELYTAWERPDRVTSWQARLAAAPAAP